VTRLSVYWLASEVLPTSGSRTSLYGRVCVTTTARPWRKRPHAGGWWLKTLSLLGELWVHWAPASNYEDAERTMLRPFEAAPELHAV
jgi:hypothetical protein